MDGKMRVIVLGGMPGFSKSELIEMIEQNNALMHIEEMKCFDFENNRDERVRLNMPALPERQTYVPTLNRKSKKW